MSAPLGVSALTVPAGFNTVGDLLIGDGTATSTISGAATSTFPSKITTRLLTATTSVFTGVTDCSGINALTTKSTGEVICGAITGGSTNDLQDAYDNSAVDAMILTTDAKDVIWSLADTTTNPNHIISVASGGQGQFQLAVGSTTNGVWYGDGRLGIGTTSPGAGLSVATTTLFNADAYIYGQLNVPLIVATSGPSLFLGDIGSSANRVPNIFAKILDTTTLVVNNYAQGDLTVSRDLFVNGADIALGTGLATTTITSDSGNLGIASITPGALLAVNGTGLFKGGVYIQATTTTSSLIATSTLEVRGSLTDDFIVQGGRVGIATTAPYAVLSIENSGDPSRPPFIIVSDFGTSSPHFVVNTSGAGVGLFPVPYTVASNALVIGSNVLNGTSQIALVGNRNGDTGEFETLGDISFANESSTNQVNKRVSLLRSSRIGSDNSADLQFWTTDPTLGTRMNFRILGNGNVGIGTTTPRGMLGIMSASSTPGLLIQTTGNTGDGTIAIAVDSNAVCEDGSSDTACALNDIAEVFKTSDKPEAGDIVMFDIENPNTLRKADNVKLLAGVYSSSPAIVFEGNIIKTMGGVYSVSDGEMPLALAGRVPTKVNLEGGVIRIGDPITLSSVAGVGMKANKTSKIIGYALENADKDGKVNVLVALGYYIYEK